MTYEKGCKIKKMKQKNIFKERKMTRKVTGEKEENIVNYKVSSILYEHEL